MDAMVSTTAAKTFAVFGDISKSYIIFDRLASARVSIIPHLFGSNQRPTGTSGIFWYTRLGGDILTGSTSGETGSRILVNKVS
jgi:predicted phage gp36 major capsid-like protein